MQLLVSFAAAVGAIQSRYFGMLTSGKSDMLKRRTIPTTWENSRGDCFISSRLMTLSMGGCPSRAVSSDELDFVDSSCGSRTCLYQVPVPRQECQ